jgi:hypothetical protein
VLDIVLDTFRLDRPNESIGGDAAEFQTIDMPHFGGVR